MTAEIIELWAGIRRLEPETPPMNLSDPLQEADVLSECRRYAISVFSRLTGYPSESDLSASVNILASLRTILESLAAGRMARDASQRALALHLACQDAIEQAERL